MLSEALCKTVIGNPCHRSFAPIMIGPGITLQNAFMIYPLRDLVE